jgi:hypothetical protein
MSSDELRKTREMWVKQLSDMERRMHRYKGDPRLWLEENDQVELVRKHIERLSQLINDGAG